MQPGEIVVNIAARDDLNQFAHTVWATPQDISITHSEGFEYIDIVGFMEGFEHLFGPTVEEKILVRDEYRIAAQELQTASYHRGAYITGQPGIGKSHFLVYLLVQLLGQGCKVAVHDTTHEYYTVFVFGEPVAFYPMTYTIPLTYGGSMWALSDSGHRNCGAPPECFYKSPERVRLIQATSPEKRRWHEWSKQAKVECYVMDIWTEQEIANFANLLVYDAQRMVDLGKKWGGSPGTLWTYYFAKSDQEIEDWYRDFATEAVGKCRNTVQAIMGKCLPEGSDAPSLFYFCRPAKYATSSIIRWRTCATVPTHTICNILGEALKDLSSAIKLEFFTALSQGNDTQQAAGFIYQAWVTKLCETTNFAFGLGSAKELNARMELPYYWAATSGYPGIDGALISPDAIFAFQITISSTHTSPEPGVRKLRDQLPADLKNLPWHVVFVGNMESLGEEVAQQWVGKVFLMKTNETPVQIAWSTVDPVAKGVTYRIIRDGDESMEVVND